MEGWVWDTRWLLPSGIYNAAVSVWDNNHKRLLHFQEDNWHCCGAWKWAELTQILAPSFSPVSLSIRVKLPLNWRLQRLCWCFFHMGISWALQYLLGLLQQLWVLALDLGQGYSLARTSCVVTRVNPLLRCVKPDGTHPSAAAVVWSTGFAALFQQVLVSFTDS